MASVKLYNMEGKEVGSVELNDKVFGVEVNEHDLLPGLSCFLYPP